MSMQASAWEQTAVLSTLQKQAIEQLSACCSERSVPEHVRHLTLLASPVASR